MQPHPRDIASHLPVPIWPAVVDAAGVLHVDRAVKAGMDRHVSDRLRNSPVEIIVRKQRSQKSQRQLGWYWGGILPALSELTGYEPDELHAYCTQKFLNPPERKTLAICDAHGVVVDEADVQLYPDRVHLLTTAQMADYCEDIRQWAALELYLDIPDPDPEWRRQSRAASEATA